MNPHYTDTRYNNKICKTDSLTSTETLSQKVQLIRNYAGALLFNTSSNICFGYMLGSPHQGDSNKYSKHTFYEELRIKQHFLHIILLLNNSLQQKIHFNGNIFENKCCHCNEASLYFLVSVVLSFWFKNSGKNCSILLFFVCVCVLLLLLLLLLSFCFALGRYVY